MLGYSLDGNAPKRVVSVRKLPIIIVVHFCSRNVLCIIVRVNGVSVGEVRIV
jgi:hypothetical protein